MIQIWVANAADSAEGAALSTDTWFAPFLRRALRFRGISGDEGEVWDLPRLIFVDVLVKVRFAEALLGCEVLRDVGFSVDGGRCSS